MSLKKYKEKVEKTEFEELCKKADTLLFSKFGEVVNPEEIMPYEIEILVNKMALFLASELRPDGIITDIAINAKVGKVIDVAINGFLKKYIYEKAPDHWGG
jgi:hypothetical protein